NIFALAVLSFNFLSHLSNSLVFFKIYTYKCIHLDTFMQVLCANVGFEKVDVHPVQTMRFWATGALNRKSGNEGRLETGQISFISFFPVQSPGFSRESMQQKERSTQVPRSLFHSPGPLSARPGCIGQFATTAPAPSSGCG